MPDTEIGWGEYWRLKARYVQLSSGGPYELHHAKAFILKAAELQSRDIQTAIDCGFFFSRVVLDSERAAFFFSRACDLLRKKFAEAVTGLADLDPKTADAKIEGEFERLRQAVADEL